VVKVCDAIMGTGKSQSAIAYMNEHKDRKFIYITPYLDEAARIKNGCPDLHFMEPSRKLSEYGFSKSRHTIALIQEGKNVATTHQAFKFYTAETLKYIREQGYVLIIDENVDVLEQFNLSLGDLKILMDAGHVTKSGDYYTLANDDYTGVALGELVRLLKSRDLIKIADVKKEKYYFWALPVDLITSFREVFILSYLFEGQSLHHFLEMNNIPYEYIGIKRTKDGGYRFSESTEYVPEYVNHLGDMINIIDKPKLNDVGDNYYALSMNWFSKNESDVEQLKNNIYNCFNNIWDDSPVGERMWGSYNNMSVKLRGRGYTNGFLTFNTKATNEYRDKKSLVYCANIFMNVQEKLFYQNHGIDVSEDLYALSVMVQWIWRSAIRDGQKINLYIPSRRMRTLLEEWISSLVTQRK